MPSIPYPASSDDSVALLEIHAIASGFGGQRPFQGEASDGMLIKVSNSYHPLPLPSQLRQSLSLALLAPPPSSEDE